MTERKQLEQSHYALFEEVNGFRPHSIDHYNMSDDELKCDIAFLQQRKECK